MNDITSINPAAGATSQATAVEQARAVAEVAAAVKVALDFPRDIGRAEDEMREACGKLSFAQRAFFAVRNRGEGPTVHLARELARSFGNVQYGVHELRRDDEAHVSEIQAFAWDVERNTRSTRTFIVPHVRMANGKRKPLTDVQDVYLNNQNIGARAVRECIFTILPAWYVDQAQDIARRTLEHGEGQSVEQRADEAIAAFGRGGVTQQQLEGRVGKSASAWTAQDVAGLQVLFRSLSAGEITRDEAFPLARVDASQITAAPESEPDPDPAPDASTNSQWDEAGE